MSQFGKEMSADRRWESSSWNNTLVLYAVADSSNTNCHNPDWCYIPEKYLGRVRSDLA